MLMTSLTGSYPPLYDPEIGIAHSPVAEQDRCVRESIERAIHDQVELGIDLLVDGQVRDDIVSVFSRRLPGFAACALPCRVIGPIKPAEESITVADYLYAQGLAAGRPVKAHVTGPMTLARSSLVDPASGYASRNDPRLVHDLASALAQEARFLVQAGAEIVQIDEPVLQDGVALDLAFAAMAKIIELAEIPRPALHVCGNVTRVLDPILTESPVQLVSIEGAWLNYEELRHVKRDYLARCRKQIGLGCIRTDDSSLDKLTKVQNFLDQMRLRLGVENIWAVMPNCGLRTMRYEIACARRSNG